MEANPSRLHNPSSYDDENTGSVFLIFLRLGLTSFLDSRSSRRVALQCNLEPFLIILLGLLGCKARR